MKKALLTTAAFMVLGLAPAVAADLPAAAPSYTKAPPPAPVFNWTGVYIGAMGGYGKENSSDNAAVSGGFAGGTLGYNWQTGALVLGVEGDAAWSDMKSSITSGGATASAKIDDMGTVRGRVGYAFDQVLIYGTGGYAWADTKLTASAAGLSFSDSHVLSGWTAGGGVEVMFAPKWSVKAEYLYRSFEGQTWFTALVLGGIRTGTLNVNSGQVGVNYHF